MFPPNYSIRSKNTDSHLKDIQLFARKCILKPLYSKSSKEGTQLNPQEIQAIGNLIALRDVRGRRGRPFTSPSGPALSYITAVIEKKRHLAGVSHGDGAVVAFFSARESAQDGSTSRGIFIF